MRILLNPKSIDDYNTFLKVKALPRWSQCGRTLIVPDEYAHLITGIAAESNSHDEYKPHPDLFDYQRDITKIALRKRKFCVFADCGLGKTLMFLEFAKAVSDRLPDGKCILIVSPLMVITQTLNECKRFYGDTLKIDRVPSSDINEWLKSGSRIGITNYDGMKDEVQPGRIGCLILDESSMLKSHYGKWGTTCLRLGKGLEWKMACTGTPAPNDRIEYANHAVFMDAYPTVNAFLAKFFVNRGQTDARWELKKHAIHGFYNSLSHWSIFLNDPSVYGWKSNTEPLPPIKIHKHLIPLTKEQTGLVYGVTGTLFAHKIGGIENRSVLSQIAKGSYRGEPVPTNKPQAIKDLIDQWPNESTIVWCLYNNEQRTIERALPDALSITGSTPHDERERIIEEFKSGRCKVLISKPKILGFGLNLEIATRQVFSGIQDSYESFYQAVKRSNRYGAKYPLNVHIPFTDIEAPMIDTVMYKSKMIDQDTIEQEELFRRAYTKK